mgnify:CR=1 FL=1
MILTCSRTAIRRGAVNGKIILRIMRIGKWMLFLFLFGNCYAGYGQERKSIDTLEVQVFFRQGYSILEPAFRNNEERLTAFVLSLIHI